MEDTLPLPSTLDPTTDTRDGTHTSGMTGGRFPAVDLFATACLPSIDSEDTSHQDTD